MSRLQKRGLISCKRGMVVLVRRRELEALSCECYDLVKKEIDAFLSGPGFPPNRDRS